MTPEELQALADQIAERVNADRDLPMMVTADELADYLRTTPDKIRANPGRWGGIRIGDGPKAHLRFPLDRDKLAEWAVRSPGDRPPKPRSRKPRTPRSAGSVPLIDYASDE